VADSVSPPTGDETLWRRVDHAAFVDSGERVVVLDLDHLDLPPYVFEGTAAEIWACLDGDRTESEIIDDLADAHALPVEAVAGDVVDFIRRLHTLGLVTGE
jgi:hypothetical protein